MFCIPQFPDFLKWILSLLLPTHKLLNVLRKLCVCFTHSVQFSCSVASDSLQPHALQHIRPPCPSPTPRGYSNSVHWVSDAIQPSHPLSSPSPPAFSLSQHQDLFKWVSSSHQVAKVFFSFSISPSNEYPGLISFRMDWLDLLAVQGTLKNLLQTTVQKHQFFGTQLSLWSTSILYGLTSILSYWKNHNFVEADLCCQSNVSAL